MRPGKLRRLTPLQTAVINVALQYGKVWQENFPSNIVPNGVFRALVMRGLLREIGDHYELTQEGRAAVGVHASFTTNDGENDD